MFDPAGDIDRYFPIIWLRTKKEAWYIASAVMNLVVVMLSVITVFAFILLYFLKRKIGLIDGRRIVTSLSKILFASTIMGMAVWLAFRFIARFVGANFLGSLVNLIVGACVGLVVFLFLAVVLRMPELKFGLRVVQRRMTKEGA